MNGRPVKAVIFDKDGTLLDFGSWDETTGAVFEHLTNGDPDRLSAMAEAFGYDLVTRRVLAGSMLIAESTGVIADAMAPFVDPAVDFTADVLDNLLQEQMVQHLREMPGASELLSTLTDQGMVLGIATNDGEAGAHTMIEAFGWQGVFDVVAGYDSGHGSKPDPRMVLGVCAGLGVEPAQAVMVGDSSHDIDAGRAAGTRTIAISSAFAPDELGADATIGSLAEFPAALASLP